MNTIFLLMAEYNTADIPLEPLAKKYFGMDKNKMQAQARKQKFPFPVFRGGTQKSEWLVSVNDLAKYIDQLRADATAIHRAGQSILVA